MKPNVATPKVSNWREEVNRFEKALEERHREQQREEMKEYLEALDRQASKELLERGGYENKGLVKRTILSCVGKVRIRVHHYKHRNGHSVYPMKDQYGIGRETERARERCIRLAIERSYGWSAETLGEEFGMKLSRMRLWKIVQEEGRREQARIEQERQRIFETAHEGSSARPARRAIIQMDGTMIASRERTAQDEFGRQRIEVKLGVLFRGTAAVSPRRRMTCERTVYARIADVDSFGEQWYSQCRRAGLGNEDLIHFLADGGPWIRTTRQAMFPGSQYTLDLYHLKRNAHGVLPQRQAKQFLSLVMTGLAETAIDYLEHIKPMDERHAQELQQFRNYVKDNREGLRYRRGQLNGSGVIEKMADLVVKKRMKRQGMRWSQAGANNCRRHGFATSCSASSTPECSSKPTFANNKPDLFPPLIWMQPSIYDECSPIAR